MTTFWAKLPMFWRFQLAGWIAFVTVALPLKYVLTGNFKQMMFLCLVRDGTSFLLTLGLRAIYRAFWSNHGGRMLALTAVVCTAGGLIQYLFFLLLRTLITSAPEYPFTPSTMFNVFYERTGLLFAWSFLYFGVRYTVATTQQELRLALIESEKRQAQLQMLRAQVNPHFLFNALNTIRAGVTQANSQLGAMVQSLADFLRFSLDHGADEFIPLGREFEAARNYLEVEKVRFCDKLEFQCNIEETVRDDSVPGIILQPLVENAVKYGQDTSDPPLRIRVHIVRRDASTLQITVANSGEWLEPAPREKMSHLGLQNLRRRLELLYPGKNRMQITTISGWVTITIVLPIYETPCLDCG